MDKPVDGASGAANFGSGPSNGHEVGITEFGQGGSPLLQVFGYRSSPLVGALRAARCRVSSAVSRDHPERGTIRHGLPAKSLKMATCGPSWTITSLDVPSCHTTTLRMGKKDAMTRHVCNATWKRRGSEAR